MPLAQRLVESVRRVIDGDASGPSLHTDAGRPPVAHHRGDPAETAQAVRGPATGLQLVGILNCFTPLLIVLLLLVKFWTISRAPTARPAEPMVQMRTSEGDEVWLQPNVDQVPPRLVQRLDSGASIFLALAASLLVLQLVVAIMIILGAAKMKRLDAYGAGISACVLASLPIHPWFWLGLPVGIWGMIVMWREETKVAFALRRRFGPAALHAPGPVGMPIAPVKPVLASRQQAINSLRMPGIGLIILGVFNAMLSMASALLFWTGGYPTLWPYAMLFSVLISLLQLRGGVHMLQRESHPVALTGAIAAVAPLTAFWPVTLPIGIWALHPVAASRNKTAVCGRHKPILE